MTDQTTTPDDFTGDVPDDWTTRTPAFHRPSWATSGRSVAAAVILLLPAGGAVGYLVGSHHQPPAVPVTAARCANALGNSIGGALGSLGGTAPTEPTPTEEPAPTTPEWAALTRAFSRAPQ